MTSHAETILANISMEEHSITELIEISQGVKQGSLQNVTVESEDEEADDIELDIPIGFEEPEEQSDNNEVQGPSLEVVWRLKNFFKTNKNSMNFYWPRIVGQWMKTYIKHKGTRKFFAVVK